MFDFSLGHMTGTFARPRFRKFTIKYIGNIKTAQPRSRLHDTNVLIVNIVDCSYLTYFSVRYLPGRLWCGTTN